MHFSYGREIFPLSYNLWNNPYSYQLTDKDFFSIWYETFNYFENKDHIFPSTKHFHFLIYLSSNKKLEVVFKMVQRL